MKYYATKVGINGISGLPEVIQQTDIGAPVANFWETKTYADINGNCWYTNEKILGRIDGITYAHDYVDLCSVVGFSTYEICGIAIDRNSEYLYAQIAPDTTGVSTGNKIYKISTSQSLSTVSSANLFNNNSAIGGINLLIDSFDNLWFNANNISYGCYLYENSTGNVIGTTATFGGKILLDQRGIGWTVGYQQPTILRNYKVIYDPIAHTLTSTTVNYGGGDYYFVDGVIDKNNYLIILKNQISNDTTACVLYRENISTGTPVAIDNLTLTYGGNNLTQCFNLHTNYDADLDKIYYYFSTFSPYDGYNTYRIDADTMTIELFLAGVGSKVLGGDPYGFYLSQYGHTGVDGS